MSVPLTRLKKKSLILAFRITPEELKYLFEDIRFKKLAQCIIRESQKEKLEEKTIISKHPGCILNLVRINNNQIASSGKGGSIKIFNLYSGECIKTINDTKYYYLKHTFTKFGKNKIICDYNYCLETWDLNNCKLLKSYRLNESITKLIKLSRTEVVT